MKVTPGVVDSRPKAIDELPSYRAEQDPMCIESSASEVLSNTADVLVVQRGITRLYTFI